MPCTGIFGRYGGAVADSGQPAPSFDLRDSYLGRIHASGVADIFVQLEGCQQTAGILYKLLMQGGNVDGTRGVSATRFNVNKRAALSCQH